MITNWLRSLLSPGYPGSRPDVSGVSLRWVRRLRFGNGLRLGVHPVMGEPSTLPELGLPGAARSILAQSWIDTARPTRLFSHLVIASIPTRCLMIRTRHQ